LQARLSALQGQASRLAAIHVQKIAVFIRTPLPPLRRKPIRHDILIKIRNLPGTRRRSSPKSQLNPPDIG
jgi:hypothetical protein